MFAKHLPPSAGLPRVLALDEAAGRALPAEAAEVAQTAAAAPFDAIVGWAGPEGLARWFNLLRPGGRVILASSAPPAALLEALTAAGFIHCIVEPGAEVGLYRGERPPLGDPLTRLHHLAAQPVASPFVFVLVWQTPNKPVWRLAPDEVLTWRAATVLDPATGQPALLAFTSLVKAVAFMQPAVLAGLLTGINKVGKFPGDHAAGWALPVIVNPEFEAWRGAGLGPTYPVDARHAITSDE